MHFPLDLFCAYVGPIQLSNCPPVSLLSPRVPLSPVDDSSVQNDFFIVCYNKNIKTRQDFLHFRSNDFMLCFAHPFC